MIRERKRVVMRKRPICITVDHDTLEDHCATIRHRDSVEQQRVKIEILKTIIENEVAMK